MKCPCNCHDPQFRKDVGMEEHSDCGLCFIELFEEEQIINTMEIDLISKFHYPIEKE